MWTKNTNILHLSESLSFYTNSKVMSRLLVTEHYVTEKVEETVSHKHKLLVLYVAFTSEENGPPLHSQTSSHRKTSLFRRSWQYCLLQKLKYPAVGEENFEKVFAPRAAFGGCHKHALASAICWNQLTDEASQHAQDQSRRGVRQETHPSRTALIPGHKLAAVLDSEGDEKTGLRWGVCAPNGRRYEHRHDMPGRRRVRRELLNSQPLFVRSGRSDVPSSSIFSCHRFFSF